MNTFDGLGSEAADRILTEAEMGTRQTPGEAEDEGDRAAASRR